MSTLDLILKSASQNMVVFLPNIKNGHKKKGTIIWLFGRYSTIYSKKSKMYGILGLIYGRKTTKYRFTQSRVNKLYCKEN